ncbi:flavonoid 3'-monooxygenase [Vigna unguiculata]|uniref:Flavonoid 3'-monooxygenase n=1 Tax=Vigna unguiculata TaxID=3917 RepID=A0A4D6MKS6_VIGUN|nr:flavonoid 3'-monooxygenase [Vigna unguiculata]
MHLKLGEASTIVVSSPEVAKDVMKTYDAIFAQRPHTIGADIMCYGSSDIVTSPYGGEKVASMTSVIVGRTTFGEKCKDQEEFISIVKKLVKMAESLVILDLFPSHKWLHKLSGQQPKLEELHKQYDVIIGNIISEAEQKIGEVEVNSLLSVLLNVRNQGSLEYPLTIDNIKAVMMNIFGGGTYTSSAIIEWAISEMLQNPKVMAKAQEEVRRVFGSKGYDNEESLEELKYLKAVIKETLRLHPPFPLLHPRECRETCELKGYVIPVGTQVIVNAWAIARDPDYWSDPEKFYPERFMDSPIDYKGNHHEFIPFGAGRRICPGISFGFWQKAKLFW